jgi:hypothetical protein
MHLPPLLALLPLLTLVAADACVTSGPPSEVTAVSYCCKTVAGTWYQFYAVQAICVIPEGGLLAYKRCVGGIQGAENPTCIPGQGGLGSSVVVATSLTTETGSFTTVTGGRETITA